MKKITTMLLLCFILFFIGCSGSIEVDELKSTGIINKNFYTKFTLHYEKGLYRTVNYRKGSLLSINSEVQILDISDNMIKLRIIATGELLSVQNLVKYSRENLKGIFERLLSEKPTDLSSYDIRTQKMIKMGRVVNGMDKKTVLLALGYPPKHETPSLDFPIWKYWKNRFMTFEVNFDENNNLQNLL